jgi:flagellar M-ring protein FliF
MVDGIMVKGDDGNMVWKERPAEELERITRLVRSAVGYDEKRGDKVEVVSLRFVLDPDLADAGPAASLLLGLGKSDLLQLLQTGMYGVLGLLGLWLVLRPMVGRLTVNPTTTTLIQQADGTTMLIADGQDGNPAAGEASQLAGARLQALPAPYQSRAAGGQDVAALLEDESMVNLANVEGQLRASSIRRVAELVDKHPEESISIVRAWMHQEAT